MNKLVEFMISIRTNTGLPVAIIFLGSVVFTGVLFGGFMWIFSMSPAESRAIDSVRLGIYFGISWSVIFYLVAFLIFVLRR